MNLRIIDLHTHSSASDGDLSPGELVRLAASQKVEVLGLTDHDTTAGIGEASMAARDLGIRLVPGIEISALHGDREYHVLGYFVDASADVLVEHQKLMSARRDRRLQEIVDRLGKVGVYLDADRIRSQVRGAVTRSHIADQLVSGGHVASRSEAFERYIGERAFGYAHAAVLSVEAAIAAVHKAGGCASLAHPGDWTPEQDIYAFAEFGLDAIEVVHPAHDARLRQFYGELADRMGLLKTGGTDFHRVDADEGREVYPGDESIEAHWLELLESAASRGHRTGGF